MNKKIFIKGFTIIETLVAIVIFALIFGAVSAFIVTLYKTYSYTFQQSLAIEEAKRGIETMVKEIRSARTADDGSYLIEKAEDKEFIFYSDIDGDGKTERVRYFLGNINSGKEIKECQTSVKDGTCSVSFSNFLKGALVSAQIKVSVDGDFGASNEYAEIFADGVKIGNICQGGGSNCSDCPNSWQGTSVFDITQYALDNSVNILSDATSQVDPQCPHSMKTQFEFLWTENLSGFDHEFRKGVIKPVIDSGGRVEYPLSQEKITILSAYVRNAPPIFEYFDKNGNKIEQYPARLIDTNLMKVFLVVNVDPNRAPDDFELETYVQLRNIKK